MRNAFEESMRNRGYNLDGTRIWGIGNEKAIFGTVQLQPLEPAVKMTYKDLVKQTDLVVEEMLHRQSGKSWVVPKIRSKRHSS